MWRVGTTTVPVLLPKMKTFAKTRRLGHAIWSLNVKNGHNQFRQKQDAGENYSKCRIHRILQPIDTAFTSDKKL